MSAPSPELIADVDGIFLGYWDDAAMAIARQPYRVGVLLAYAWRDGGIHVPADDADAGGPR